MSYTPGIDISAAQPRINAAKIRAAGKRFVVIKGLSGERDLDRMYVEHKEETKSANLLWTVYQFALPDPDPKDDVRGLLDLIMGDPPPLAPWLDLETLNKSAKGDVVRFTDGWIAEYNAQTGGFPVLYSYLNFLLELGPLPKDWASIPLALAVYNNSPGEIRPPSPWTSWTFHQHSANETWIGPDGKPGFGSWRRPPGAKVTSRAGLVDGVVGEVDLDSFNGSEGDLYRAAGLEATALVIDAENAASKST